MGRFNLQIKVGTYDGDGVDNRSISGVGFRPTFVLIKGGAQHPVFKTRHHQRDVTSYAANTVADLVDAIQEFLADGFQVGTSGTVNALGTTYHYIAIRALDSQSYFRTGQYFGTGADDRNFTGGGLNFTPDFVLTKRNGITTGCFRTSSMAGDLTAPFATAAFAADYIQSLIANGFQLGTNDTVNNSASYYNFLAFKALAGIFAVGSYAGDAADDRNIVGVGFQPDFVLIKASTNINRAVCRFSTQVGDETLNMANVAAHTNGIQSFLSDGFQVGNHNAVNASAGSPVYHWVAIKQGNFQLPIVRTSI